MLTWPEDGSTLEAKDIVAVMRKAFKSAYTFRRLPGPIQYDGPDRPVDAMATPPTEMLSYAGLEQAADNGHDALDQLILVTFQLGCEQGVRIEREMHDWPGSITFHRISPKKIILSLRKILLRFFSL